MFTKDQTNGPAKRSLIRDLSSCDGFAKDNREQLKARDFAGHYGRVDIRTACKAAEEIAAGDYPLRLKPSMFCMEWTDESQVLLDMPDDKLFDMIWRGYLIYVTDWPTALAVLRTGHPGHGDNWRKRVAQATYHAS